MTGGFAQANSSSVVYMSSDTRSMAMRNEKFKNKVQARRDMAYIEFLVDEFEKTVADSSEEIEYGLGSFDHYMAKELDGSPWLKTVQNEPGRAKDPSDRDLQPSDYMLAMLILVHGGISSYDSFSNLWREMLNTTLDKVKKNDGSNDTKREGEDSRFLKPMQLVFIILLGCHKVS